MKCLQTLALGALVGALAPVPTGATTPAPQSQLVTTLDGLVVDLALDANEKLLYCTDGGDVARVEADGTITLLVDGSSGAFPTLLRALHPTPGGDIAVLDAFGDLYHVPAAGGAPTLVYQDLFLLTDPTDLIVDASGNHVVTALTISTGYRALAWIDIEGAPSPSQTKWSYYLVDHQPVAISPDPQTGGLLMADATAGGALLALTTGPSPETSPIDQVTLPGFGATNLDGDLASESDGSAWWVAGSRLYHHDRIGGLTSLIDTGSAFRRGVAVAPSSPGSGSVTGYSAWFVEGAFPTELREVVDAAPPAPTFADSLGEVPGPGEPVLFHLGLNVQSVTSEPGGTLLVGGDQWDLVPQVRRIDPVTESVTVVASDLDGIPTKIEGIQLRPDGSILALSSIGETFLIEEGPLSVTPYFTDPGDQIVNAKGLATARDGSLYLAERAGYNWGRVWEVDAEGSLSVLAPTEDTRGAVADPFTDSVLVSEWMSAGFGGRVAVLDELAGALETFGAFDGLNFSNGSVWGDGDLYVDSAGGVYTSCEDGFAVHRYDRATGSKERVGAGYLNRPSGMAIAPSRPATTSSTGWSLYVSEWNNLWEIPGVPAPAPHILDRGTPPIGAPVGFVSPAYGVPRFALADPAGGAALIGTAGGYLLRLPLDGSPFSVLAGPAEGLAGDLVAGAVSNTDEVLIVNGDGTIFSLSEGGGWSAVTAFDDPLDQLEDVRSIALRDNGDIVLTDRPAATPQGGRVGRVTGGSLTDLARTARGESSAICPLTGELFVTQRGQTGEVRGEVLRVAFGALDATVGHVMPADLSSPRGYAVGERAGALAFADDGDFYVVAGEEGRVHHFDRSTGDSTLVAGGYLRPAGLFLASGSPGVAGVGGASLFVLDGYALYEHGIDGLPAPVQAAPAGGGDSIDMGVAGLVDFGGTTRLSINRPEAAGETYFVLPGFSGKGDGFPLGLVGDPSDTRILPLSADPLWFQFLLPPTFLNFQGVLDVSGQAPPATGIVVPADPALESAGVFLDLFWLGIDLSTTNGVSFVGGTTHIFLGP